MTVVSAEMLTEAGEMPVDRRMSGMVWKATSLVFVAAAGFMVFFSFAQK
jgi:hypothetical protein